LRAIAFSLFSLTAIATSSNAQKNPTFDDFISAYVGFVFERSNPNENGVVIRDFIESLPNIQDSDSRRLMIFKVLFFTDLDGEFRYNLKMAIDKNSDALPILNYLKTLKPLSEKDEVKFKSIRNFLNIPKS
jgi:hypothetical protein